MNPGTEEAVDPHEVITHHLPILEGGCQPMSVATLRDIIFKIQEPHDHGHEIRQDESKRVCKQLH